MKALVLKSIQHPTLVSAHFCVVGDETGHFHAIAILGSHETFEQAATTALNAFYAELDNEQRKSRNAAATRTVVTTMKAA